MGVIIFALIYMSWTVLGVGLFAMLLVEVIGIFVMPLVSGEPKRHT
jgi:hypothetical protein